MKFKPAIWKYYLRKWFQRNLKKEKLIPKQDKVNIITQATQ